jgi:hypothetical protein
MEKNGVVSHVQRKNPKGRTIVEAIQRQPRQQHEAIALPMPNRICMTGCSRRKRRM